MAPAKKKTPATKKTPASTRKPTASTKKTAAAKTTSTEITNDAYNDLLPDPNRNGLMGIFGPRRGPEGWLTITVTSGRLKNAVTAVRVPLGVDAVYEMMQKDGGRGGGGLQFRTEGFVCMDVYEGGGGEQNSGHCSS